MGIVERLSALLPGEAAREITACGDALSQIRLRAGRPVQLIGEGFRACGAVALTDGALKSLLGTLMEHSVYAWQEELDQGYFTLEDGTFTVIIEDHQVTGMELISNGQMPFLITTIPLSIHLELTVTG